MMITLHLPPPVTTAAEVRAVAVAATNVFFRTPSPANLDTYAEPSTPAAPRVALEPSSRTSTARAPLPAVGATVRDILSLAELRSPEGAWAGGPLAIHDNPESYARTGVLCARRAHRRGAKGSCSSI